MENSEAFLREELDGKAGFNLQSLLDAKTVDQWDTAVHPLYRQMYPSYATPSDVLRARDGGHNCKST